jgi:hypothetical protein
MFRITECKLSGRESATRSGWHVVFDYGKHCAVPRVTNGSRRFAKTQIISTSRLFLGSFNLFAQSYQEHLDTAYMGSETYRSRISIIQFTHFKNSSRI